VDALLLLGSCPEALRCAGNTNAHALTAPL
jgi:hypothetical protein